MEMALPYAVTALEAYGATTSASFLSGAVHGFTGEFEWSALGTGSKLGAAEKAGLAIGVIRSHTSITKLGGMISNVATGAVTGAATRQVTSWFAKGTARAVAQETTAKTVQKTTKVAVQNGVANQAVSKTATKGIAKEVADDHIWIRASPFRNKSAKELDAMFRKKGFDPEGPDALNGLGNYINRKNGRQYHIDPKHVGRYAEPNHVDVGRAKAYSGNLGKKRFGYLDD
ncbi:conserved hypothetical protein [Estrella lausannensis]|uniref:Uncharacterized protein n=2 Tax=Estrella lausannensis TaxID=483423 RepID=A0A0H5DQB4_9BACT|nr:conserved hypothetical protein [Estrella lausannensis]